MTELSFTTVVASCEAIMPITDITEMMPIRIAKSTIPVTVAKVYFRKSFISYSFLLYVVVIASRVGGKWRVAVQIVAPYIV